MDGKAGEGQRIQEKEQAFDGGVLFPIDVGGKLAKEARVCRGLRGEAGGGQEPSVK